MYARNLAASAAAPVVNAAGIDDRHMAVGRKHVDHAHILVDQRIGRVDDAERGFAAINERQRRAHAVGAHQPRRDLIPDAEIGQAPHAHSGPTGTESGSPVARRLLPIAAASAKCGAIFKLILLSSGAINTN